MRQGSSHFLVVHLHLRKFWIRPWNAYFTESIYLKFRVPQHTSWEVTANSVQNLNVIR